MPNLPDPLQRQWVGIKPLGSHVLCERHNNALHRLDSAAVQVQATLERYQSPDIDGSDPGGSEFDLVSGDEFERWLLKVAWGYKAIEDAIPGSLKESRERDMLLRYLFRDGLMPKGWGLYMLSLTGSFAPAPDVGADVCVDVVDDRFQRADVTLAAFRFSFVTGAVTAGNGALVSHRPAGVRMLIGDHGGGKVLAFGWDHAQHAQAEYVDIRFRGRG